MAEKVDVRTLLPLVSSYWRFESLERTEEASVAGALEQLLSDSNLGAAWLAEQDGKALGYLIAVYVFSLEHLGLTAEIDEFFVMPDARRSGAGSELLATAEAEFKRRGCSNASLQLSKDNHAARDFYRRHGYSERSKYELLEKTL